MRYRKLLITTIVITSILSTAINILSYSTYSEKGKYTMNRLYNQVQTWFTEYKDNRESNGPSDLKTHPWLTLRAIQLFEGKNSINLSDEQKTAIIQGSIEEDFDIEGTASKGIYSDLGMDDKLDSPTTIKDFKDPIKSWRCFNHFMNASNDGLLDHSSALKWATTDEKNSTRYYEAVRLVKEGKIEGWRYLGHVLHLLEDMSVPAHVRGDMHLLLETYELELRLINIPDYCKLVGNCDKSKLGEPKNISTNKPDEYFIQLAVDTRNNFYSDDTLNILPNSLPSNIVTCDDDNYLCNSDKGKNVYVAKKRGWIDALLSSNNAYNTYYKINDKVVTSMFSYLGLQAIQHGAGLIKLFHDATATFPTLVSSSPTNGATEIPTSNKTVSFTFSVPMANWHSVYWTGLTGGNESVPAPQGVWSSDKRTKTYTFQYDFDGGRTIGWTLNDPNYPDGFRDLDGNMLQTTSGSFRTAGQPLKPSIDQTPMSGPAGETFTERGTGFTPNSTATLHFQKPDGTEYPTLSQPIDSNGTFSIIYKSPADKPKGTYIWWGIDGPTGIKSNSVFYTII